MWNKTWNQNTNDSQLNPKTKAFYPYPSDHAYINVYLSWVLCIIFFLNYKLKCVYLIVIILDMLEAKTVGAMPDIRERREGEKYREGRGWPMSHLPSLHLAMTATRGRCHRNHNLKKGGITFNIRVRCCGERRVRQWQKQKNNMTWFMEQKNQWGGIDLWELKQGNWQSTLWGAMGKRSPSAAIKPMRTFCTNEPLHTNRFIWWNVLCGLSHKGLHGSRLILL